MNIKEYITELLFLHQNNSRRVISVLKKENLWNTIPQFSSKESQNLYDFVFGKQKECSLGRLKFVSFSVGYQYCSKTCKCCLDSISQKVSTTKSKFDAEQKIATNNKRKETNLQRYGMENLFMDSQLISESINKKYGVSNSRHIPGVDQKIKETNIRKYGVDNPSKNQNIKSKQIDLWNKNKTSNIEKHKNSLKKMYGVENARHIPGVDQKIKETNIRKYGVDNPSKNQNIKNKISKKQLENFYSSLPSRINQTIAPLFDAESYNGSTEYYEWKCLKCCNIFIDRIINGRDPICRKCNPYTISRFEKEVRDFLHVGDYNRRDIIFPYELDIYIPQLQLAIECNGVYRHSECNGKDRNYHLTKTKLCEAKSIKLIQIYDVEWYEKRSIVESILNSNMGKNSKIYARNCKIFEIENKVAATFLKENHIQGAANAKICLGLYSDDLLASVMTFGKSRYNKKYEWELIRFANKTNFNVIGGANKQFQYFVKHYNPVNLISYCDMRLFSGNVYSKMGFKKIDESKPGYYYFNVNQKIKLEAREKFQKHKLKNILSNYNQNLTEWENMRANNYDRIWNCGNTVWEWKK